MKMEGMIMTDVLAQAEGIITRYDTKKPTFVDVRALDWKGADPETRELLVEVSRLKKSLDDAYWKAVETENWRLALLAFQRLVFKPFYFYHRPEIYGIRKSRREERKFIKEARLWIADAEGLLSQA
jgi:hypothetical protein